MNDFKVYLKAARNTARQQIRVDDLKQQAKNGNENIKAAAKVTGRRYRQARMNQRLLAAFRDLSLMALSLGAIWFVFSRVVPIPFTPVIWALGILFVLRLYWAIVHNPYLETTPDDPLGVREDQIPAQAKIKSGKRRGARVLKN